MKKAISYMACSMAAMLALSACGSAASSTSTVASSSDAASTESTAASEASNEPVTITFAQYSGSGDNEQYLQQMVDNYMKCGLWHLCYGADDSVADYFYSIVHYHDEYAPYQ